MASKKATHAELAGQLLSNRVASSPRLPRFTRHVMTKLATGNEAAAVWKFFGSDEETVGRVTDRVRQAFEQALLELQRPSIKDERDDIERVVKLAGDLKLAIKTSSLPGNWCRNDFADLSATWGPDVELSVGWHSLNKELDWQGYPLAICDVLDWAAELAKIHLENLPARSVTRRRKREGTYPEIPAFVRRLAWHFKREFGKENQSAIAHVANALFALNAHDALDARAVQALLKDRPKVFAVAT